jgi:hypothetical protein
MRLVAFLATIVLLHPVAARGEGSKKELLDHKALDVLKTVGALFKDSKSFHCDVDIDTNLTDGDKKQHFQVRTTIEYQKPDRLAMHCRNATNKNAAVDVVSDGKKYCLYLQRFHQYIENPSPKVPDDLGRELSRLNTYNTGLIAPNVINRDPYEALLAGVAECSYAGREQLGGTAVHHLKFVQPGLDWEVWVAAEGKPFVLKAATSTSSDDRKVITTETYRGWRLDEAAGKDTFKFEAPAGAKKVEDFGTE